MTGRVIFRFFAEIARRTPSICRRVCRDVWHQNIVDLVFADNVRSTVHMIRVLMCENEIVDLFDFAGIGVVQQRWPRFFRAGVYKHVLRALLDELAIPLPLL